MEGYGEGRTQAGYKRGGEEHWRTGCHRLVPLSLPLLWNGGEQTTNKHKRDEYRACDGKNATWSSKESAKRQECIKWSTASINIGGTRIVGGIGTAHNDGWRAKAAPSERRLTWQQATTLGDSYKRCCHVGPSHFGQTPWETIGAEERRSGGEMREEREKVDSEERARTRGEQRIRGQREVRATSRTICPGWPQREEGRGRVIGEGRSLK